MIVIVNTGGANLLFHRNALKRLNKKYIISSKKSDIQRALSSFYREWVT